VVATTAADGTVRCPVQRVGSVCRDNRVEASLALEAVAAAVDTGAVSLLRQRVLLPQRSFSFPSRLLPSPPSRPLAVFLNGQAAEVAVHDGDVVRCTVPLDGPGRVVLLQIGAAGRMALAGQVEVRGEASGEGWEVRREDGRLVFSFGAPVAAQEGCGVETLVALALPPAASLDVPPGGLDSGSELLAALARQGAGDWGIGSASYEILPR
ncbi:MAG: hypothetical protein AB1505_30955, partial [Candidatus Latescibacterota bacterium]